MQKLLNRKMPSLFISLVLSVFFKDIAVSASSLNAAHEVICANGGNATFNVSFELESGDTLKKMRMKKGGVLLFEAPFQEGSTLHVGGIFHGNYRSRSSTNFFQLKGNFKVILYRVSPDDEGQYTFEMTIWRKEGTLTSHTLLVVDSLPGSPSISGAPTSVFGEAGPTVLTCTANLGKPQASMLWSRRIGSGAYTDITENVNTTTANNSDGTTSGTSILTVKLDAADDGAQFRCQVSNRQATLSAETGAIEVSVLPSSPYISGVPTSVFVGAGPTVLTCTANLGKPQASMLWSRRIGSGAFADITENINTTTAKNSDGTTTVTSILTVNLDVADDGAKFRCQVSNRQATLSAETGAIEVTDTTKPTTNGEGRGTIMPTENGEGGATVKPTGDEGGRATVTPTETGGGGVSAGCDNTPSKIILGAAFVGMATISTTG